MKTIHLGSDYGGWSIDIDSIKDGDTILDAGLGEDITFLEELLKIKDVKIIGIDPTAKSHAHVENKKIDRLFLIKHAIAPAGTSSIRIFRNSNPNHVSESYLSDHGSVTNSYYEAECSSFKDLIKKYSPSLIKMDIEGAEYDVIEECIGVKQICIEFHHHCVKNKSFKDTLEKIKMLEHNGYKLISSKNESDYSFLLS